MSSLTALRPDLRPTSSGRMPVDLNHPFFFDHPLDHLPGLLLIHSMANFARDTEAALQRLPPSGLWVRSFSARFVKFAEFGADVQLSAREKTAGSGRFEVEAEQSGVLRARASVEVVTLPRRLPAAPNVPDTLPVLPRCAHDLVNKWNPVNVLITQPEQEGDTLRAAVMPQPAGHSLGCAHPDLMGPLYLLEAVMQTQRFLNQATPLGVNQAAPLGAGGRLRDTLCGVSIDLSRPVTRDEPVCIERDRVPTDTTRGVREHGARLRVDGGEVGRCNVVTLTTF